MPPSKSAGDVHTVLVRMPQGMADELQKLMEREGDGPSMPEMIRRIIEAHLVDQM